MGFSSNLFFSLEYDADSLLTSIVTNAGGLVRMPETIAKWGRRPGLTFGHYLHRCAEGSIGVVPSNYIRESGAFLVIGMDVIQLAGARNDDNHQVFGFDQAIRSWGLHHIRVENGLAYDGPPRLLGWNGPILRCRGQDSSLEDIAAARCADPRNLVNFGAGSDVNNLIGAFLPSDPDSARRLIRGKVVVGTSVKIEDWDTVRNLRRALADAGTWPQVEVVHDGLDRARLVVHGKLKLNRIPVTVVGCTEEGELRVVVIDGRQPEVSVGATIPEILEICREHGLHTAVMGGAGSDATIAMRVLRAHDVNAGSGVEVLNYGFNVRPAGVCLKIGQFAD